MIRDVSWIDFKQKHLEDEFEVFSPGVESINTRPHLQNGENVKSDNDSSISTYDSDDQIF